MIKSLSTKNVNYTFTSKKQDKKFEDPLHEFPLNILPYSNSAGVLVGYMSPKLGGLLWAPALMYYGADIYDKYKNDKDNVYNPSAKRAFKQVVFQAGTNLAFPVVATAIGSKIISVMSMLGKDKLSLNTKEYLLRHHLTYTKHSDNVFIYSDFKDEYKKTYNQILTKHLDNKFNIKTNNPYTNLKRMILKLDSKSYANSRDDMIKYINNVIDEMFDEYKLLEQNKKPKSLSKREFKKFQNLKKEYAKAYEGNPESYVYAIYDTLKDIQLKKLYQIKIAKMLGGLSLIIAFTKPVENLVKKYFVNKVDDIDLHKFQKYYLKPNRINLNMS